MTRRRFITIFLFTFSIFHFPFAASVDAAFRSWTKSSGEHTEADLLHFDLAAKVIVLEDEAGREHTIATRDLNFRSQFQLLFSPRFLEAFPEERWSSQRLRIILTLTGITAFFFLVGFWLAAIFIVHNANPFKALLGWIGSLAVAAFLFWVYFTATLKFPEHTTAILGAGAGVSFIFAAVFVSAVYNSKIGSALALFVLHFATGILLVVAALHALDTYPLPPNVEAFFTDRVFRSIGLL